MAERRVGRARRPGTGLFFRIGMLLSAVVLVYLGIVFGPPCYRYFGASTIIKKTCNQTYSIRDKDDGWTEVEEEIRNGLRRKLLKKLKIGGDDLRVEAKRDGSRIRVNVRWKVRVRYPLIGKTTTLKFSRTGQAWTR